MSSYHSKFVQTAGYQTHLFRSGVENEEAVLLLHGAGPGVNAQFNWPRAIPFFGRYFDCLAPDLLGFGQTEHPVARPQPQQDWVALRAKQVLSLLDALEIGRVHLVGQSSGGGKVALKLLEDAPDRLGRVVIMGAAGTKVESISGASGERVSDERKARPNAFYEDPSPAAMARMITRFVYDARSIESLVEGMAEERFEEAMRPEIRSSFEAMNSPNSHEYSVSEEALNQMTTDILLVHGRDDRMVPVESSYYLLEHLPNAQLHVFPKCGHWVQLEHSESFHRLLLSFLSRDI